MTPAPPDCPIPGAHGMCSPEGSGANGVLMLGEAMGEAEMEDGLPFRPYAPAGSVLERAIRRCGYDREAFVLWNAIPTHPPKNYINPNWEGAALAWGRPMLEGVIREYKPRCILALGTTALKASTGVAGDKCGASYLRGYVLPGLGDVPVVAALHPAFLRRGAMPLLSVLMHDIKLAVAVAATKPGERAEFYSPVLSRAWQFLHPLRLNFYEPEIPSGYILHPSEEEAWDFLRKAESRSADLIAYDIETPHSASASENDTDELAETDILSIQFSLERGTGVFLPWREPFFEIARRVLALPNPKAGCNNWRFDDPLLRAHGCRINGEVHDIRWAFHHLQPDLKAHLQFIMSFYQEPDFAFPWKHLAETQKAAYGCLDVDAVQRVMG